MYKSCEHKRKRNTAVIQKSRADFQCQVDGSFDREDNGAQLPTHHLEFDLYTQALLLDGSHACGEGLPHAGGSSQGELGAALQTCNGARQHGGPAGPAHEQATDILPAVAKKKKKGKFHAFKQN